MSQNSASLDRARVIDAQFQKKLREENFPTPRTSTTLQQAGLDPNTALEIFRSQMISRHLDLIARQLKEKNLVSYTIASSGHEGNAAIAEVFDVQDMAFLHYRSLANLSLSTDFDLHFVVHSAELEYLQPARLDQLIYVLTEVEELKFASIRYAQEVRLENPKGLLLCRAKIRLACSDSQLKIKALPDNLMQELKKELSRDPRHVFN